MKKPLYFFLPVLILIAWEIVATVVNNAFILPRLESIVAVLHRPFCDDLSDGDRKFNR